MKVAFAIPETPTIRVIYTKSGTNYAGIIANPKSTDGLVAAMLTRQVGVSQIVRLEPIQPRQEFHRGHPAAQRLARYATAAEH
jgi:hypothetical protein